MSIKLIFSDRKFWPLFWTQFLGALNDNFFKNALVVLITFKGVQVLGMQASALVAFASGIFILPFFLFSPLAGQLSDKFEKSKIIKLTKLWEFLIMVLAALGFYFNLYSVLLGVLFLMGTQSTFFGPVKYSIIPELVEKERLTEGNAYVELGTFIAILVGTIAGGLSVASANSTSIIMVGLLGFSALGILSSWFMKPVTIANASLKIQYNPIPTFSSTWKLLREKQSVFYTVLGISWFWFFGAGILSVLPVYCKDYLFVNEEVVTTFLAMFTIGIGFGSILCDKLSFKRVEIGLVPIGSLGLSVFLIDLFFVTPSWTQNATELLSLSEFWQQPESFRLLFDFFLMSVFGGIFTVPLYTFIQERSHPESRSQVVAGNNILNALFMVVSSLLVMALYQFELNPAEILFVFALINIVVAVYIYSIVPEFTLRFYAWIISHLIYRLKVTGLENIPKEGPCILACNHVTFIDWLIISGVCKRPPRFVMHYEYYHFPVMKFVCEQAKAIPIATRLENAEILETSYKVIERELRDDQLIIVFPEGSITKNGEVGEFRPGILKMLKNYSVPVVPVGLGNLWGSFFRKSTPP